MFKAAVGSVLVAAGLWHLIGGAATLAFGQDWSVSGVDLSQRWREQRYVRQGQNPMTVAAAHFEGDDSLLDPAIGVPGNGGYPPWAYAAGAVPMRFESWDAQRRAWAAVCLASAGFCAIWAWATLRPHGRPAALLAAGAVVAVGGGQTAIAYGQWTWPVVAAAAGAVWLERRRPRAAGVCLALAMTKVTLVGPLAVPVLVTRRWRTLTVMAICLTAATAAVCWRVGTPPWAMLAQMADAGAGYAHRGYDAAGLLILAGVPDRAALVLAAGVVLAVAAVLHWRGRRRPLLWHWGVAAAAGRFWTYHKGYDNPVLIFLLIALLAAAVGTGRRRAWAGFWIAGVAAWLPPVPPAWAGVQAAQALAWIAGVVALATTADLRRSDFQPRVIS